VLHVFIGYHDAPSLLLLLVQFSYLVIFSVYVYKVYKPATAVSPQKLVTRPLS